jgi:hypothetical protein
VFHDEAASLVILLVIVAAEASAVAAETVDVAVDAASQPLGSLRHFWYSGGYCPSCSRSGVTPSQIFHTNLLVICDLLVTHHPQSTISKKYTGDAWFCFRHNFSKKLSPGLKTSLERRAT